MRCVDYAAQESAHCGVNFKSTCHPERAKRVEGSSHFDLVQYANRCEDPSAASAPNGSDFAQDDRFFEDWGGSASIPTFP